MTFKDIIAADITNTFLNPAEFGEEHMVNNTPMIVIIDDNEVVERSKKQVEKGRIEGLYVRQMMMYVSRSQYGRMPAIGSIVTVDGNTYRVSDVSHEGGMYAILLGAYRS